MQRHREPLEHGGLQRRESSQREKGNVRYALLRECIDEGVVSPLCHVVVVLDANDLRNFLCFLELPRSDVAEADVANQSLALQLSQRRQGLLDGSLRRLHDATDAQIDHAEPLQTQIAQIVVNPRSQLLA